MPAHLANPVARLLDLLTRPAVSGRWLIGLSGLPGSGKSTTAVQWVRQVNLQSGTDVAAALGMDGFHLPKAALARFPQPTAALARRGAPWTFDPHGLRKHLVALRAGQPLSWPGFEHAVGDPVADALHVGPQTRLVVVEGLYLLHTGHGWDLADFFDEHWFLDVSMDVAMTRLTARHMSANGQTRAQAQARLDSNDRLNAAIAWRARNRADWLVDTPPALLPA